MSFHMRTLVWPVTLNNLLFLRISIYLFWISVSQHRSLDVHTNRVTLFHFLRIRLSFLLTVNFICHLRGNYLWLKWNLFQCPQGYLSILTQTLKHVKLLDKSSSCWLLSFSLEICNRLQSWITVLNKIVRDWCMPLSFTLAPASATANTIGSKQFYISPCPIAHVYVLFLLFFSPNVGWNMFSNAK